MLVVKKIFIYFSKSDWPIFFWDIVFWQVKNILTGFLFSVKSHYFTLLKTLTLIESNTANTHTQSAICICVLYNTRYNYAIKKIFDYCSILTRWLCCGPLSLWDCYFRVSGVRRRGNDNCNKNMKPDFCSKWWSLVIKCRQKKEK